MLDHVGFPVSDYERSRAFYVKALLPLGIAPMMEVTREQSGGYEGTGFGRDGKPWLWIGNGEALRGKMHVAFTAFDHAAVDAFYRAAMDAGGRDNGAPGIRAHYHPNYYSAFVLDPDDHNIEAVCHTSEA